MATRINTKFVLLLGIAVFTVTGVVGVLWVFQIRGDTSRNIEAGDAMMVEARALEAAGEDAGASVIFEKAVNEYGRAVSKEPEDLGHLRKVKEALLSLRPMSRDQANEFEGMRIGILRHELRYQLDDAEVHLALVTELYRMARLFEHLVPRSDLGHLWQEVADAGDEMHERLLEFGDPKHVYGRLYRGLAQMHLMGYGGGVVVVRSATQEEIDAAMADLTAFVQAVPENDLGQATLIDAKLSLARQLRSEGSRLAAAAFEEVETLVAAALEAVPDGPEIARLVAFKLTLEYLEARRSANDPELIADPELVAAVDRMVDLVAPSGNPMLLADAGAVLSTTDRAEGLARWIELLDKYVDANPDAHYQRSLLARLYYANRDVDGAREQCLAVLDARPVTVGVLARILQSLRVQCAALIVDCEYAVWESADEADKAAQLDKAEDAREVLSDLVTDPHNEPLLLKAEGKLAFARRDHATAAARFERVCQLAPDYEVLLFSAQSLERIDQLGLARQRLAEAVQRRPLNFFVLAFKAQIEFRLGLHDEAQATAEAVLELDEGNEAALRVIASMDMTRTGPDGTADTELGRIMLDAQAAIRDGDLERARTILLEALDQETDRLPFLFELVRVELWDERPEEAKKRVDEALALQPGNTYLRKVKADLNSENQIEAIDQYMADLYPDEADRVVNTMLHLDALARALEGRIARSEAGQDMETVERDRDGAIVARDEMLTRAQEIAPGHPALIEYLFNGALVDEDWSELESLLDRATAADSDLAGGLIFRGRYDLARKNYEQAIRTLTEATERKNYSATAWRFLGRAHERVGNFAEAVRAYEHAYIRSPNDRIAIEWYVRLLVQTGERDRALRVLRATRHTMPNDAVMREFRLHLEAEVGDAVVAIRERRRLYASNPQDILNAKRLAVLLTTMSPTYEHVVDPRSNLPYKADDWQLLSESDRQENLAETTDGWVHDSEEILAAIEVEGEDGVAIAALRATLLMKRGLVDEGEQVLRDYRDLNRDDVRVYLALGAYQLKRGLVQDAIATLKFASQYQEATRREADLALANLYFDRGVWDKAGELYEGVVADTPSDDADRHRSLQLRLVECLTKLDRFADADTKLTEIVATNGQDFPTAMLRAAIAEGQSDALFEAGLADRAELKVAEVLASLNEAERLGPSSALPHVQRAQLLFKEFQRRVKADPDARTGAIFLLDDALANLNHADRVNAGADSTSRLRVAVLEEKGDVRGAIGELTRFLQRSPNNTSARTRLVRMLVRSGNFASAMQVIDAAIELNPSVAMWHDALGELHGQRARTAPDESAYWAELAEAAVAFSESHDLEPKPERLAKWAEVALSVKNPDYTAVTSRIEEIPDALVGHPVLRAVYAMALTGEKRNDEALEQMRLAWAEHAERDLELQPDDPRNLVPWYQMLQKILSGRDPAEFEQVVRELSDGEPTPLSLTWIARIWGAVGPHQSLTHAIALLDTAASRCPAEDYEVRSLIGLDRGSYHVSLGNFREAAASFEEVIVLAASDPNVPDHATALNNAAFLYAEYLDDPDKAADYARSAAVVRPDDPSILDTLGWALFRLGRYEESEEQLKRSKAIKPTADNFLHLAWVYYETDRRGDVPSYLLKAEELNGPPEARQHSRSTQIQIDELRNKLKR